MLKNIHKILIIIGSIGVMAFTNDFQNENVSEIPAEEEMLHQPIVVLELFTSQGCSSCPSADLLLQKVKKEYGDDVFALSYHVDYWNYIGWKDPFSSPEYTKKQRQYNIKFRNRSNYTPQLVVNGKEHFVGSNSTKMYGKINEYKEKKTPNELTLNGISVSKNKVSFGYDVQGSVKGKIIRTLLVLDERITEVKRGENRNRTLRNSNIVVAEQSFLVEESTGEMEIFIPKIVNKNDKVNLIVLIESEDYDITGAAKKSLAR